MLRLKVIQEGREPRYLELDGPRIVIGRAAENDVVIDDSRSSRRHCRLSETPHGVVLEDLKSSNGTLHQGKTVSKTLLKTGEEFSIGGTRFLFDVEPDDNQAATEGDALLEAVDDDREPELLESDPLGVTETAPPVDEPAREDGPSIEELSDDIGGASEDDIGAVSSVRLGRVVVAEGPNSGLELDIDRQPFTIGRSSKCDLTLEDNRASGSHAEVRVRDGRLLIQDLGSKNGIGVGDRRIRKAILAHGMSVSIGSHLLRFEVDPAYRPARDSSVAVTLEEGAGQEAGTLSVDVASLESAERWQQPLSVLALVGIIGLLAWFAIDLTRHLGRRADPDPIDDSNRIASNWSFETVPENSETTSAAGVPGWTLGEGGEGRLEVTEDDAQAPGLRALRLVSTPSAEVEGTGQLCVAEQIDAARLGSTQRFFLQGFCRNESAWLAALRIEWLQSGAGEGDGDRARVLKTDWSEAARGSGASVEVSQFVIAPSNADSARVACVVYGGGSAVFDRISLAPQSSGAEVPSTEETGTDADSSGEGVPPVAATDVAVATSRRQVTLEGSGPKLELRISDDIVLSAERARRTFIHALWAGFDSSHDPVAFGPRLSTAVERSGKGGGVVWTQSVPNLVTRQWAELRTELREDSESARLQWELATTSGGEVESGESAETAGSLAVYIASRHSRQVFAAHGAARSERLRFDRKSADENASAGPFVELVFGEGDGKTSFEFSPAVGISWLDHPSIPGLKLIELRPESDGAAALLSLTIASGSRSESRTARLLLAEAERLFKDGDDRAALLKLDEVIDRYPQLDAESERAKSRKELWEIEVRQAVTDFSKSVDLFASSPTRVVHQALGARAAQLEKRYGDTPQGRSIETHVERFETAWRRNLAESEKRRLDRLLELGRKHFAAGEYGLAELCLERLKARTEDVDLERSADSLIGRLRTRLDGERKVLVGE